MSTIISSLPAETLSLIFELVRTTTDDYWQAQTTLRSASLVARSWRDAAQRELAYEVRLRPRSRQILREGHPPRTVLEHLAQPWLQSLAFQNGRCKVLTLPPRLTDVTVEDVLAQCEGLKELTFESWVTWGVLRTPTLSNLKTLLLNASMTDPTDSDNSLPFRLTHLIWDNGCDLTSRFLHTLLSHSTSSISILTLKFPFPGLHFCAEEHLPLILPHLRHLNLHPLNLTKDECALFSSCTSLETLSCTPATGVDMLRALRPLLDVLPVKLRELSLGGEVGAALVRVSMSTTHPLLEHSTLSELKVLSCEGRGELRRVFVREG
ncbi:hypothetical protein BCR35DRAFT_350870 [Leucosporidium creatinivorum]|uniref:Uncharacterized protein n=1 Tax=Leucosporidium creatinivorum TaxID=106004 RepID=A0A1Y2FXC2_9BASI|nr:hypothetical protein BCR35DRAFT_350870 [Leucosporidium creatinivorum]